ncbi:RICIN domain-containing protein [Streptomyces sp. cmx-4-9]|uniref:RICIN domain-containing protein n=1 Tax=Streptomyces sp. cmx-4-9 TaxID=2790941 RepID=UPI003980E069
MRRHPVLSTAVLSALLALPAALSGTAAQARELPAAQARAGVAYTLTNLAAGRCLATAGTPAAGAWTVVRPCTPVGPGMKWSLTTAPQAPADSYFISEPDSGTCLTTPGTQAGARPTLQTCDSTNAFQMWTATVVADDTAQFKNLRSGLNLAFTDPRGPVTQEQPGTGPSQQWRLTGPL